MAAVRRACVHVAFAWLWLVIVIVVSCVNIALLAPSTHYRPRLTFYKVLNVARRDYGRFDVGFWICVDVPNFEFLSSFTANSLEGRQLLFEKHLFH